MSQKLLLQVGTNSGVRSGNSRTLHGCVATHGRGVWRDNVFVERVWRSVKYERVYLKVYDSVSGARADIADYFRWYNADRAHSSLDDVTPEQAYLELLPKLVRAA